jgi:hypothetical protein
MNDTETITLTRENLHALSSTKDGFKASQLAALGVPWPPRKGWLSALIGQKIPVDDYLLAMERKDLRAGKWKKAKEATAQALFTGLLQEHFGRTRGGSG